MLKRSGTIAFHAGNGVMDSPAMTEQGDAFQTKTPCCSHRNGVIAESNHQPAWYQASRYLILKLPERAANMPFIHFHTFA